MFLEVNTCENTHVNDVIYMKYFREGGQGPEQYTIQGQCQGRRIT